MATRGNDSRSYGSGAYGTTQYESRRTCGSPEPQEREHVNYESACGHQIGFLSGILALAPSGGQRQVLRVFHGIA